MLKQWPDNMETVLFPELCEPIYSLIKQQYKLRFRGWKDLKYEGYTNHGEGAKLGAGSLDPEEAMTAENLRYSLHEQGRDPLREIIAIAIQLGIEQGTRIRHESCCVHHPSMKEVLRNLRSA